METEPKHAKARSHRWKRWERAKKLLSDSSDSEGELVGDGTCRLPGSTDRNRSKSPRKKDTLTYEEDIIDGFAMVSFSSMQVLTKFTQDKLVPCSSRKKTDIKCNVKDCTLSPANCKDRHSQHNINKKEVNSKPSLDTGYLVSDASLDIFSSKPLCNIIKCDPALPSLLPPVSMQISTIATATPSPLPPISTHDSTIIAATPSSATTVSIVCVTTVNSTASCTSLNTDNLPATALSVTLSYNTLQQQQQQLPFLICKALSLIEDKYSANSNNPEKCLNETYANSSHLLIKRSKSPSLSPTESSPKPKRTCSSLASVSLQPFTTSSPVIRLDENRPSSTLSRSTMPGSPVISLDKNRPSSTLSRSTMPSSPVISLDEKQPSSTLSRSTMPRQELCETDDQVSPLNLVVSKSLSPDYPSHASFPASIYSPLMEGPWLHPLHARASQSATFPVNLGHHPSTMQPQPQHNKFNLPMSLGLPDEKLGVSPAVPMATHIDSSPLNLVALRDELNLRFLASHAHSSLLGSLPSPPLLLAVAQQHKNQHQLTDQHQDVNECTHLSGMIPQAVQLPFLSNPSPVLASSNSFGKLPGSAFYLQGLIGGLPSSCPAPIPNVQYSRLTGAFQPTSLAGLHGAVNPLYMTDCEKQPISHLAAMVPPTAKTTTAKKPGIWCAVHKHIAWAIFNHQQNQTTQKRSNSKTPVSLRPPILVLPGGPKMQPADQTGISCSAFLGNGLPIASCDLPLTVQSRIQALEQQHYLQPIFLSPWTKLEDRAILEGREKPEDRAIVEGRAKPEDRAIVEGRAKPEDRAILEGREKPKDRAIVEVRAKREDRTIGECRTRELGLQRLREEAVRERERRLGHDRHQLSTPFDNFRPDVGEQHFGDHYKLTESRSMSRSRSPVRNGHVDSVKLDKSYERQMNKNSFLKVKDESHESLSCEDDTLIKNDYLMQANSLRTNDEFMQGNVQRAPIITPADFIALRPPLFLNSFTQGPMGLTQGPMGLTQGPMGFTQGPMGLTQAPMGFTQGPMGFTQGPMGLTQGPMGFTQGPMGLTQGPMGLTQGPMGLTQGPMGLTQGPMGLTQGPMDFTQRPMGFTQGPMGLTQGPMDFTQRPMGFTQGPMGFTQRPMGFTQGPMRFQNQRYGLLHETEACNSFLHGDSASGLSRGFQIQLPPSAQMTHKDRMFFQELQNCYAGLQKLECERNIRTAALRSEFMNFCFVQRFLRNASPAMHIRNTSPSMVTGVPFPFINAGSSANFGRCSSLAMNNTQGVSPVDSVGESKRDSSSNSTDPDAHLG